jgi:hypothetical protein
MDEEMSALHNSTMCRLGDGRNVVLVAILR